MLMQQFIEIIKNGNMKTKVSSYPGGTATKRRLLEMTPRKESQFHISSAPVHSLGLNEPLLTPSSMFPLHELWGHFAGSLVGVCTVGTDPD